jgi:hypothetical protein
MIPIGGYPIFIMQLRGPSGSQGARRYGGEAIKNFS